MTADDSADRLSEIVQGLQVRLEGELRGTRAAVRHPTGRGDATETDWLRLLRDHLPGRYCADSAFVIDARGSCSDQIDLVIYDRQYSPLLYNEAGQRYVPAESVYAVLEVKQDLTRAHVEYAGQKAASVRRLHRTSAPIPYADGTYTARRLPPIIAGILTFESSWSPPFGDALREVLTEIDVDERLNIGCALLHGTFEVTYSEGLVNLAVVESGHSLVQLLYRLLKQLQALATVPAIDYGAYLDRLVERDAADG